MAFTQLDMTALIVISPDKARAEIEKAYRKAKASVVDAAKIIGCSDRTLRRWIEKLDIRGRLDQIEAEAWEKGWHHNNLGGRPPTKKESRTDGRARTQAR